MDHAQILEELQKYGPAGLALAAFLTNLIPGMPAIYLTFVGAYASLTESLHSATIVTIAAGVGAGLGKVIVFLASSLLASKSARVRQKREEYLWIVNETRLGVFLLILLFAALPLPDDVLYIPLGISGFSLPWFTLAVILGKIVLTGIVVFLGRTYWTLLEKYGVLSSEGNLAIALGGFIIGTILVTAFIFSIDWKKIYEALKTEGWWRATIVFLEEVIRLLTLQPLRVRLQKSKNT